MDTGDKRDPPLSGKEESEKTKANSLKSKKIMIFNTKEK